MKPLAIIPARRSSRRLPDKNLRSIGSDGRSLLNIATDQARRVFDLYAVTTDLGSVLVDAYPWVFPRRPELCGDDVPMMDVVRDMVDMYRRGAPGSFDAVVLLQPTSPLRTDDDIRACVDALDRGADAVISVTRSALPELFTLGHAGRLRSQDLTGGAERPVVRPNGAVFAITTRALDAGLDWWTANVVTGYEMPAERSVDIDTIYDLEAASRLWEERHGKPAQGSR